MKPTQAPQARPAAATPTTAIPPVEVLQAARELLLKKLGPCAASRSELVLATAREIMVELEPPPAASANT